MNQLEPQNPTSAAIALANIPQVAAIDLQHALAGDLSKLPPEARLAVYGLVCTTTGLNPATKPFDWMTFQGKLTLYPNKGCAEQLRELHTVSLTIVDRKIDFGCLIVTVKGINSKGRYDEAIGAVPFNDKMGGEVLANAMMKAETKAKRRLTLSICGLGFLDTAGVEDSVRAEFARDPIAGTVEDSAPARAERLNAQLTAGEKSSAIPISETAPVVAQAASQEAPLDVAAEPSGPVPTAATIQAPAATIQPQVGSPAGLPALLSEDEVRNLEIALGGHNQPQKCVAYMEFKGAKKKGAGMETLRRNWFTLIIANPQNFFDKVDAWLKEGK